MYVAKTKALISFAVTAKLICVFVFAYVKYWFSHDAAQMSFNNENEMKISLIMPLKLNWTHLNDEGGKAQLLHMSRVVRKPVFGIFRPGLMQNGMYSYRRWLES